MRLPIIRESGGGRVESLSCTSAHGRRPSTPWWLDAGQHFLGIWHAFGGSRVAVHTCRLCFQVNAAAKATVQFGLELTHFLAQFAEFLLKAGNFVVDFVHGGRQAFLHIGKR